MLILFGWVFLIWNTDFSFYLVFFKFILNKQDFPHFEQ